jgi:hypothetical protein
VPIARLAIAACALLAVTGCGVARSSEPARAAHSASPTAAAERSEYPAAGPIRVSLGKGVALTAEPPMRFTPTDTAYPRAKRAVAVEVEIDNGGTIAFNPALLSFVATVDARPAEQVIDSSQGYPGVSGVTDEVAPGQTLRFTVAFGVPDWDCVLRVWVRPDSAAATVVELYDGVV